MFSPGHAGAGAYARVGNETGVMNASPHRLIAMLYEGARKAIGQARFHMQQGNVARRGETIGQAIAIVENGLQAALDRNAGGEIAERLDKLYSYMARRLLEANIKSDESMLVEVDRLLATIEEAWTAIGPEVARMAAQSSAETMR
jgi:flagellar secretion chaperone FliS